jgi:hypothetical protein
MRGAVLHGLDLDIVERRIMRHNYGTELAHIFDPNTHPDHLKFRDEVDGSLRCKVLKWYAKKADAP